METRTNCAYNHTRECFLGLQVSEADIQYTNLRDLTAQLTLKSGEGLWIVPFKEIQATSTGISLDLVYLDANCVVLEVAESFLTTRSTSSSRRAASVLALPTHTIYSSQTQPGDQLVICAAEEMECRLEQLNDLHVQAVAVQSPTLLREEPAWNGVSGLAELESRSTGERPEPQQPREASPPGPAKKNFVRQRNWLQRWWSPDPRKAAREEGPGASAYYWTGAPPAAHHIRDISSTGLYLVTEERWYPGTLVLMTLQRTDCDEQDPDRSIHVHTRAVRWGNDGVGLEFVLADPQDTRQGDRGVVETADRKALDRFLEALKKGKS
jgi:hypothetical protein